MSDTFERPAWARESAVLRLPDHRALLPLTRAHAWGGATGRGVRVAVVDSGIEGDHPALEGCTDVAAGVDVVADPDGVTFVPGPHDDTYGHGTACASIVHAIAPRATIVSVRVLGSSLSGRASQLLAGLEWAIDQRFDVINLSLGATRSDAALALYELCDRAYFAGALVVTAANNVLRPSYPSLYGSVVSVACNLADDPLRFHANPSPPTEFLARGIDVDVAWKGGTVSCVTGNSYAAPHISGIAALIKSKHPGARPFQIKTALWATASNVLDAGARAQLPVKEVAGRVTRVMRALPADRRATIFARPGRDR